MRGFDPSTNYREARLRIRGVVMIVLAMGLALFTMGAEDSCSGETEDPKVEKGDSKGGKDSKSGDGEKVASVGDKVTLKGTTYQVTSAKTAQTLGDPSLTGATASGVFIVVKAKLTNKKDEPATILEDNIRLIGGNGKNYSTSDDAILATGGQTFLLEEIQPDNTESGTLVYDLPKKAVKGAKLQVQDLFSDSKAEIKLGL